MTSDECGAAGRFHDGDIVATFKRLFCSFKRGDMRHLTAVRLVYLVSLPTLSAALLGNGRSMFVLRRPSPIAVQPRRLLRSSSALFSSTTSSSTTSSSTPTTTPLLFDLTLPEGRCVAVNDTSGAEHFLHPLEYADPTETFRLGRLALRRALPHSCTQQQHVCGKDAYGRPILPEGFLGSISHKNGVGVALVQEYDSSSRFRGIGVDLEVRSAAKAKIASRVLTERERAELGQLEVGVMDCCGISQLHLYTLTHNDYYNSSPCPPPKKSCCAFPSRKPCTRRCIHWSVGWCAFRKPKSSPTTTGRSR